MKVYATRYASGSFSFNKNIIQLAKEGLGIKHSRNFIGTYRGVHSFI